MKIKSYMMMFISSLRFQSLIFQTSLPEGAFVDKLEKANVAPVHKREYKIYWKIIAQLTYLLFLVGFLKESSVNLFLTIFSVTNFLLIPSQTTHQVICALPNSGQKIQTGFDSNPTNDMKSVLLEISKAFNKIWQDGLEFK